MSNYISIKRGDTYYVLQDTFTNDTRPMDLTDTDVYLAMRNMDTNVVSYYTASVLDPATSGSVEYQLTEDNVSTVGRYQFEWTLNTSQGVLTVPNTEYNYLFVTEDLG